VPESTDTEVGHQAFAAADWEAARTAFEAALRDTPDDPEALDGLGRSLWWLGDREAGIARRRDAYAAFQRRGNARAAGGLAVYLAGEHRIDGRAAESSGWLARARRLLADQDDCTEAGWLAVEEAKRAEDLVTAERHARAALAIAHAVGDADVECMALAQIGRAVVRQGRIEEGAALLDEAMTVALSGESHDPLACGDACCTTLVACDGMADVQRAAQWCESVVEFSERRRFLPLQGWCRGIYGGVLVRGGDWVRAEQVLDEALRRPTKGSGRVTALAALAELRILQGRTEEAGRLLERLEGEPAARAALVHLHIVRGDTALAAAFLEQLGEDEHALVLRAELALATGDADAVAAAGERLTEIAQRLSRPDLAAHAAFLGGRHEAAVQAFTELGLPFNAARARLALATAQADAGSPLARATAQAAYDGFERLGARQDADRAGALLRRLGATGRRTTVTDWDELTGREREVLDLICDGLSNTQIAERLVIAPKTAEHHVGRVLNKLGARNRAEAAALATRAGLSRSRSR
jgi:DNA-binding CsgD family transcriptional regulator/Tfp pilus assembly protein PilF